MFKFLKEKLRKGISALTRKVEDSEVTESAEDKKGFLKKLFGKGSPKEVENKEQEEPPKKDEVKAKVETKDETLVTKIKEKKTNKVKHPQEKIIPEPVKKEEPLHEEETKKQSLQKEESVPEQKEKKGFFKTLGEKITTTKISDEKFDDIFLDIEMAMMESNVAVEVIEKIKHDLKRNIVGTPIKRGEVEKAVISSLKGSIVEAMSVTGFDILSRIGAKKPAVICFIGVNGSGKTTTIAKIAKMLLDNKKKAVIAASDTFRAAAIDQLQEHANNLGIKLIKHDYGSDPAAVAFDAIKYAKAKDIDVVLVDTAGRLHSNTNLMDELKKVVRVSKPDLVLFIGESITGNDCVEQAQKFSSEVNIDGIILTKADIDEKGGAALSIAYVTKKPILFLGTGQSYSDIEAFDPEKIAESLGLE
ncbi:signal recognition particle-docking protein FtsY [Candidatus Woesearchaeota archaeon]|nr:signal recognition particle-docking protein FtsY [Candidatus Woesearchaeota archaeon]